jgi:hypothetical protein
MFTEFGLGLSRLCWVGLLCVRLGRLGCIKFGFISVTLCLVQLFWVRLDCLVLA